MKVYMVGWDLRRATPTLKKSYDRFSSGSLNAPYFSSFSQRFSYSEYNPGSRGIMGDGPPLHHPYSWVSIRNPLWDGRGAFGGNL
ncbi:MAG: hypothetical protein ACO3EZ_05570 [Prochlorotrichaceae cyanobacterium]